MSTDTFDKMNEHREVVEW